MLIKVEIINLCYILLSIKLHPIRCYVVDPLGNMLFHMDQFIGYPEQIIALKVCSDCTMSSAGQVFFLSSMFWINQVFGQSMCTSTSPWGLITWCPIKCGAKPPMDSPQRSLVRGFDHQDNPRGNFS